MADPLSITTAVVGITTASFGGIGILSNTIKNIRHAPESVRGIQRELEQLTPLLARLELAVSERPTEVILGPNIKLALETCNQACVEFRDSLTQWTRRSNYDKSSLLDNATIGVLRQGRIRLLNDQLNQGIKLLSITLDTATYLKMSQQEDRVKESGNQMLLDIESRIAKGVNEAREDLKAVTKHEKRVMELHQNENEDKTALLNEISRQKTMIEALQRTFEEELKATVSERTKQNIRDIKTADNSMGLTGFINTDKEEAKVDQNISQIYTDGDSVSVTGMAKNIDIVAMLSLMKSSKK